MERQPTVKWTCENCGQQVESAEHNFCPGKPTYEQVAKDRADLLAALRVACKTLGYCALPPTQLAQENQAQFMAASNTLAELHMVLARMEGK